MTSSSSGLGDKGSSSTDEGVVTSSGDDDEGLTTLDSGRSIAVVTSVLVNSERLASDSRLVNLNEAALGNEATISRDDGSLFNLENITGHDLGGLNFLESTVTEDNSLESKCFPIKQSDSGAVQQAFGVLFLEALVRLQKQGQGRASLEIHTISRLGKGNKL